MGFCRFIFLYFLFINIAFSQEADVVSDNETDIVKSEVVDVDIYIRSNHSFEFRLGVFRNTHLGENRDYLGTAYGLSNSVLYQYKTFAIGFGLSFVNNKNTLDYPDSTIQDETRVNESVGFIIGKMFPNIQYLLSYDVIMQQYRLDKRYTLSGKSYGLHLAKPISFFTKYSNPTLGPKSLDTLGISLFVNLKYNQYDLKEASGLVLNLGFSVRFKGNFLKKKK